MGSVSNFCDCKNSSSNSCMNGLYFDEMQNMICPSRTWTNNSRKDFLTNRFNNNISLEELIKIQAVNKIIRVYREYKLYKQEKLKYNTCMNGNNIIIENYDDLNDDEDNNDIKLKYKKKKKVNFLQNVLIQDDKNENSNEDNQNNEENSHSNESQNSENKETNDNNNNQKKKNTSTKNNDGFSDRMKYSSSSIKTIYTGGGTKNQKEGFGINKWNDEAKYIGYYRNNKAEGYGKFIAGNDLYQGEFKDDAANGYGIFNNSMITFEGYWNKELQEGCGIETWKDGSMYKGEYSDGKKTGVGTYSWSDGTWYEGMWENNTFNGYGIFYFLNGRYYLGEWKDKKKNGFGEFIWPEKKYVGFYSNDKKNGLGIMIWKDGRKAQIGFWKDGKQFGFGKFMNKKKSHFGLWKSNNKVDWFRHNNDGVEYLIKNNLQKYKNIFNYNLEQLYDFCYTKDGIEILIGEKNKTKNAEFTE